jgi:hypothetical protein
VPRRLSKTEAQAFLAEEFGRRNAVEGELLVRLHPRRIVALDYIDD